MLQAISQGTLLSESILSFPFTALRQPLLALLALQHRDFTGEQVVDIKHN